MNVQDKIKYICELKDNNRRRIEELKKDQESILEETKTFLKNEIYKIEQNFKISSTDSYENRKCEKYNCKIKDGCLSSCGTCSYGMCEQCKYGYTDLVPQLMRKFSIEELKIHKEYCPYALIAYIEKY